MELEVDHAPFATMQTRLTQVKLADIVVRPEIQRRLERNKVNRIIREFKPWALGVFHLWEDDGILYVIDAQHRTVAAQEIGTVESVDAKIYSGINKAEAIDLFIALNTASMPKRIDRFLLYIEADDPAYIEISNILAEYGYTVTRATSETTTSAAEALERIYFGDRRSTVNSHPAILHLTMQTIVSTWAHGYSVPGPVLEGIGAFYHRYGSEVNQKRLIDQMVKRGSPHNLMAQARSWKEVKGHTLPWNVARILLDYYNSGRHAQKLIDW